MMNTIKYFIICSILFCFFASPASAEDHKKTDFVVYTGTHYCAFDEDFSVKFADIGSGGINVGYDYTIYKAIAVNYATTTRMKVRCTPNSVLIDTGGIASIVISNKSLFY